MQSAREALCSLWQTVHSTVQLLQLLMNRYADRPTARLEEGVAAAREKGTAGADETAAGFAEWYRRFREEKAGYTNFGLMILTLSATDEQLRARMSDWYRRIFERLRGSPAGDSALIAVLAIEGLFYLRHFQLDVLDEVTEERILNTLASLREAAREAPKAAPGD